MAEPTEQRTAAQKASDYFNSLPIEQRRKLAPLLEDHRLRGMREYADAIDSARRRMSTRMSTINARPVLQGADEPEEEREPTDDEIYNRHGMEGGIPYDTSGDMRDENNPGL